MSILFPASCKTDVIRRVTGGCVVRNLTRGIVGVGLVSVLLVTVLLGCEDTPTPTAAETLSNTPEPTKSSTSSPSPSPESTPVPTNTPTSEPAPAATATPTHEPTPTPVPTNTPTPEPTMAATATSTRGPAPTPVPTNTPTPESSPVAIGTTVEAGGSSYTLNEVMDPAPPGVFGVADGKRLIALDITQAGMSDGGSPYNPLSFAVQDADGYLYDSGFASAEVEPLFSSGDLAKGQVVRGWVISRDTGVSAAGLSAGQSRFLWHQRSPSQIAFGIEEVKG